jgi:uncharacterized protein (TIGR02391 family)
MRLTFDPMTIEHLGFKMYSHLPNAVAELVANAYDADARKVAVELVNEPEATVRVVDDGHGMSAADLEDKYLRIGRNRLREGERLSESGNRRVAGKKGLGKLALFGIGLTVTIRTKRASSPHWTLVELDWDAMLSSAGEYEPKVWTEDEELAQHGTTVTITQLKRKTRVNAAALAESLSRLFNYVDNTFELWVHDPAGEAIRVTRELRYESIDIESTWNIPDDLEAASQTEVARKISGKIYASAKPLTQQLRGITVYINGRLANDPEYFGVAESSYAFSYLTGYVDADYIDDLAEDVISTDRRSITWELPEPAALRVTLQRILNEVGRRRRQTRRSAQRSRLREELNVDPDEWAKTIRGADEAHAVETMLDALTSPDSAISDTDRRTVVEGLRTVAPAYADLHWRNLHPSLREACEKHYQNADYLTAILEAIKRYVNDVRRISGMSANDMAVLQGAFAKSPRLDILTPWIGLEISEDTQTNLRTSQRELSTGLLAGFRNPIAHEEMKLLEGQGIFTYQDCLDALSILSHLRRRIDPLDNGACTKQHENASSP